jgi:imidazole glycerol-phosphate synthase subunit HisH
MRTVAIVDYGAGNLDSVNRAVQQCGGTPLVTGDPLVLEKAERIILPGVGSFQKGMRKLRELRLDAALNEQVLGKRIPFLGICLGMQFMAEWGHEVEETPGLGWIAGQVVRLQSQNGEERIPHIGWNEVVQKHESRLLEGIPSGKDFYFVHSYHLACRNADDVLAVTPFCGEFICAVARDNIFGVQFHPEKSQKVGSKLLTNFLAV